VTKLTASNAENGNLFGWSVAISGDTAVIGAIGEDTWGNFAGASYVFQRDEGGLDNWGQVKRLIGFDTQAFDNFGASVSVSGDTVVVGAIGNDGATGAVYVYHDLPKQADPGDTDGDGCSDERENGPDETLGGMRNHKNSWDYYDVNGDQLIDLPNDVLGVVQHYAPAGTEPAYDVTFDRGPSAGPNPWNMTAPDGAIDLSNDILGVVQQYLHSCQ
jgi:hypothetical protein